MCVAKDNLLNKEKEAASANSNHHSNSNWTQLFRKPLKPRLPRKIVSTAKSNLNKYWHKFEEMLASDSINATKPLNANCITRTSYRLMPPMLAKRSSYAAPPSPPPSPIPTQCLFPFDQHTINDELNQLMAKQFTVEKNLARSSMYKHFSDESLYHGVNLSAPPPPPLRCTCAHPDQQAFIHTDTSMKIAPLFNHRHIQMSHEDQENLDNEAMEVYTNFGYELSF